MTRGHWSSSSSSTSVVWRREVNGGLHALWAPLLTLCSSVNSACRSSITNHYTINFCMILWVNYYSDRSGSYRNTGHQRRTVTDLASRTDNSVIDATPPFIEIRRRNLNLLTRCMTARSILILINRTRGRFDIFFILRWPLSLHSLY
jgi:hypothetical protein